MTPLQVGKYAEYFVKMELTKCGFDAYTSEVDDKGIDFVICTEKPRRYYDVQVKSVRGFNYVFFRKEHFDLRDNLYAALVILVEGEQPGLYLVPSRAWDEPNQLFVSRDYGPPKKSTPEWGLNLSQKNYPLLKQFGFEEIATKRLAQGQSDSSL